MTCGGGSKTRMRNCTNPKPRFGGRDCQGNNISNASCDTFRCAGKIGVFKHALKSLEKTSLFLN